MFNFLFNNNKNYMFNFIISIIYYNKMSYQEKYIKYKNKYLQLKSKLNVYNLYGGSNKEIKNNEINNLKKLFEEFVPKIKFVKLIIKPFLEYANEDENIIIPKLNENLKKIFYERLKKNYKNIISLNIYNQKFYKIEFNEKNKIITLYYVPKKIDYLWFTRFYDLKNINTINDIINLYDKFFIDIIEVGPDTWMGQNSVIYIKKGEIDDNQYWLSLKHQKSSIELKDEPLQNNKNRPSPNNKNRPSPSESATLFKIGTKKIGNDGNIWLIVENKNGIKRWKKN
jgi:hypothetical protein